MRLIDADALKNHIIDIFDEEVKHDKKWAMGLKYSLKLIDNAPTIEVTKVKCKNKDKYWCYSQCPYADTCENGTYER